MPKTQRTLPSIRHVAAYNATTPKLGASAKKAALSHAKSAKSPPWPKPPKKNGKELPGKYDDKR